MTIARDDAGTAGTARPDIRASIALELIRALLDAVASRGVSPSTSRTYGILRVTRLWGTARATVYRHRRCDQPAPR